MKRLLLWLALGATLIAVYFAPEDDKLVPVAATKVAATASRERRPPNDGMQRASLQAMDLQIRPRQLDEDSGNVFASHSWNPPPKPPEKPKQVETPPPPPAAPPLPFRFLGRLVDDGETAYFLQLNDRNIVMHIGDTVDKTYTLDGISNGTLTFTYLPLNEKQTLVVGEVN